MVDILNAVTICLQILLLSTMHYVKMNIVFGTFLFLIVSTAYSQKNSSQKRKAQIDSLQKVLKTQVSISVKIKIHSALGRLYVKQDNYKQALNHHHKALAISQQKQEPSLIGNSYHNLGIVYYYKGEYQQALDHYQKALDIRLRIGHLKEAGNSYSNRGIIYEKQKKYNEAIREYKKARSIFQQTGNQFGLAANYLNVGIIYDKLQEHSQAIANTKKALSYFQKIKQKRWVAAALNNIGNTYKKLENYNQALDYLKQALRVRQDIGSKRGIASSYLNIGSLYSQMSNYEKALEYQFKALDIRQKLGNKRRVARILKNISYTYNSLKNYEKALEYAHKALEINQKKKRKRYLAKEFRYVGDLHKILGNYTQAKEYYEKSLEIDQKYAPPKKLAKNYSLLGGLYIGLGNYEKALEYQQKALEIRKKLDDTHEVAKNYTGIAIIYEKLKDYQQSLDYHQKALTINQKNNNQSAVAMDYNNIGFIYEVLGNYAKALEYQKKSLDINKKKGWKRGIALNNFNQGKVALSQKRYQEALAFFTESMQVSQTINAKRELALVWVYFGIAYGKLQNYTQALNFLDKGIKLAEQIKRLELLNIGLKARTQIHRILGNYKQALEDFTLFKQTSDSLFNAEKAKKIARLEANYALKSKQDSLTQIQQLEKSRFTAEIQQRKITQTATWLGLGLLLLLVLVLGLFYYSKQRSNRMLALANAQLLNLDQFKQQMLSMIVHDLKNPLNSIIGLSDNQQDPRFFVPIYRSGRRMHDLVMNILDVQKLEEEQLVLHRENASLNDLINTAIEQVKFVAKEKKHQIQANGLPEAKVHTDRALIIRVMVNLLTNASKYTPTNGHIHIEVVPAETTGFCKVKVTDSGLGIAPEHLDLIFDKYQQFNPIQSGRLRSTGLGLTFSKLAIQAHGGKIGATSTLGKGATFWFTLPLVQEIAEPTDSSNIEQATDIKDQPDLPLNPQIKQQLQPFAAQVAQYQVYETGAIQDILATLDTKNATLQHWKTALEDSIYACDDDKFQQLLKSVQE